MAADVDLTERSHRKTYGMFIGLMKYGAIISIVTGFIVILIISS